MVDILGTACCNAVLVLYFYNRQNWNFFSNW